MKHYFSVLDEAGVERDRTIIPSMLKSLYDKVLENFSLAHGYNRSRTELMKRRFFDEIEKVANDDSIPMDLYSRHIQIVLNDYLDISQQLIQEGSPRSSAASPMNSGKYLYSVC